jgi:hypothetical protein
MVNALSMDPMRSRGNTDDVPRGLSGGDITVAFVELLWQDGLEIVAGELRFGAINHPDRTLESWPVQSGLVG